MAAKVSGSPPPPALYAPLSFPQGDGSGSAADEALSALAHQLERLSDSQEAAAAGSPGSHHTRDFGGSENKASFLGAYSLMGFNVGTRLHIGDPSVGDLLRRLTAFARCPLDLYWSNDIQAPISEELLYYMLTLQASKIKLAYFARVKPDELPTCMPKKVPKVVASHSLAESRERAEEMSNTLAWVFSTQFGEAFKAFVGHLARLASRHSWPVHLFEGYTDRGVQGSFDVASTAAADILSMGSKAGHYGSLSRLACFADQYNKVYDVYNSLLCALSSSTVPTSYVLKFQGEMLGRAQLKQTREIAETEARLAQQMTVAATEEPPNPRPAHDPGGKGTRARGPPPEDAVRALTQPSERKMAHQFLGPLCLRHLYHCGCLFANCKFSHAAAPDSSTFGPMMWLVITAAGGGSRPGRSFHLVFESSFIGRYLAFCLELA